MMTETVNSNACSWQHYKVTGKTNSCYTADICLSALSNWTHYADLAMQFELREQMDKNLSLHMHTNVHCSQASSRVCVGTDKSILIADD